MKPTLIVLTVSLVVSNGAARAAPEGISVQLDRPNGTGTALILEKFFCVAEIWNASPTEVGIVAPPHGSGLEFRSSQSEWRTCPDPELGSPRKNVVALAPGARSRLLLDFGNCAAAFPDDMKGRAVSIDVRVRVLLVSGAQFVSEPRTLRIDAPTGLDAEAHRYLTSRKKFDSVVFLEQFGTSVYAAPFLVADPRRTLGFPARVKVATGSFDTTDAYSAAQFRKRENTLDAWVKRNGSSSFLGQLMLGDLAVSQAARGDTQAFRTTASRIQAESTDSELREGLENFMAHPGVSQ